MPKSRYTLIIEGLSSSTRSKDIRYTAEKYGTVRQVERDVRERCALVEFKHSRDAEDAYDGLEGKEVDGRAWRVDFATGKDLRFFGWPDDTVDDGGDKYGGHGGGGGPPASSGAGPSPVSERRHE